MGNFFKRLFGGASGKVSDDVEAHLRQFVATRNGVAGYFEEATSREPAALVLVAADGEWTRRKTRNLGTAKKMTDKLEIDLYEVAAVGYPREMREWSARKR